MCTTSGSDLEDIPLDDDDSTSIEFKILEFYAKHHVFKRNSSVFSPKRLRTRSLSQKVLGNSSSNESWLQVSGPYSYSSSSEKLNISAKKKSPWRSLFGGAEKEEDSQSVPTAHCQGPRPEKRLSDFHSQQWPRSLSNVEQREAQEVVAPEVVSIANRVAEIVYSWPPLEEFSNQGLTEPKGTFSLKPQGLKHPISSAVCVTKARLQALLTQKTFHRRSNYNFPLTDGDDQLITKIVELLKYSGDQLERELRRDKNLMSIFQDGLSYSVFKTITNQFLQGVDTRGESEIRAQSFKAALAIDVMAKLTAIDNHPMNRVLGFGTKYLKENFSPWVQQHGGWEKVLGTSHEEVD